MIAAVKLRRKGVYVFRFFPCSGLIGTSEMIPLEYNCELRTSVCTSYVFS